MIQDYASVDFIRIDTGYRIFTDSFVWFTDSPMRNYNFYLRITSPSDLQTLVYLRYRVSDSDYYLKRPEQDMRCCPTASPHLCDGQSFPHSSTRVAYDSSIS